MISVIIPTYNSQKYFKRCLDSVTNQSFKNLEIIIVDDQSTDSTLRDISEYSKDKGNIKITTTTKKGLAGGARNVGLKNAKGQFISFIDSDDWIDTNYYAHMLSMIEENSLDVVLCGVKREYENAKYSSIRYSYSHNNIITGHYALTLLSRVIDQDVSISAIVCNKLFRHSIIKNNGINFIENSRNEDDVFIFKILLESTKVGITGKTNYHQYQRRNSISRTFTRKNIDDLFYAFAEIKTILEQKQLIFKYKSIYYSFFEKCLSYLIETLHMFEHNSDVINRHYRRIIFCIQKNLDWKDFLIHCGNKRIKDFLLGY